MFGFSHFAALAMVILALSACGAPSQPSVHAQPGSPPAQPGALPARPLQNAPADMLKRVFDRYWDERIPFEGVIAPQSLADSLDVEKRYLGQLVAISPDSLNDDERLSYDIFKEQRETAIEGFTYPGELLPIDPFGGMLWTFPAAAAESADARMSPAQYDSWLRDVDRYVRWTHQAIVNMQDGVLRRYTSPRAVIERALPILEHLGTDSPDNVFYTPLHSLPRDMARADLARLSRSLHDAVVSKLLPATRALHDYLEQQYLAKARPGLALAELPLGPSWYAYRVRRAVGSGATPADVYRAGMAEVLRLKPRLESMHQPDSQQVPASPRPEDALQTYRDLGALAAMSLPALFATSAPADYEIRLTDHIGFPATALYYRPSVPGAGYSAVLYVNTAEVAAGSAVAEFLGQAVPGLHYQSAIQQQRMDLPRFRRFGTERAFVAGWGLYAASLGEELGMLPSDADKYRALSLRMRCAVALVVDTGLHSQGWTRTQALQYLHAQMSIDDGEAQALVDSYAAAPGDSLSCAAGGLRIQAIRSRAQQALGANFDAREFHARILRDGAMPLDILEAKMNAWMNASR